MKPEKPFAILIVEDDPGHLTMLKTILQSWGYAAAAATGGKEAVSLVKAQSFDLILMDVRMPDMNGIEALRQIRGYNPAIPVLIMTAYSSVESAVAALKAGAYDYLTKPLDFEALKHGIERVRDHVNLREENRLLKEKLRQGFDPAFIIGKSRAMRELMDMAAMIAPSDATVLITGGSGTGKELIARAIHQNSGRRDMVLVTVNCAAISESLLESELFGHEKGAFTGADRFREGRFAQAHQGSLFLDEIGEMPVTMQAKLLRALQEGEIQRVGSDKILKVDVRIIAATNQNLAREVETGRFREDLYYRLNVVNLTVPDLRDRIEDIPLLAQHFLSRYADKNRKRIQGFSPLAMDMLLKYPWPGNVRELENAVERAVILLTGDYVTERELPAAIVAAHAAGQPDGPALPDSAGEQTLEAIEKEAILKALAAAAGNKSETARRLGINRKTLHQKLKKYEVE
ncbi:MAG: sigma-54-dependent transcriptional regulator [Thermodesulfobacteriota bacterium]